jgi:tetratricopeptide (TPR) repeat protein
MGGRFQALAADAFPHLFFDQPPDPVGVLDERDRPLDRKLAREPTEKNLSQLALHLLGTAETFDAWDLRSEAAAHRQSGSEILQKLIEDAESRPLSAAEQTDLAWKLLWQGSFFRQLGDDERALETFKRAAELARKAYESDKSLQFAFNHASRAHREMGELYEKQGDFEKALEMYRFSFDWLKTRENDTKQTKANHYFGVHFYANRCALMLNRLGRQKEADEIIEKPFSDYSAFLDLEEDGALVTYAHEPFLDLAKFYGETKQFERAAEIWKRHIARLQKFLDRNPDDLLFMSFQANAETQIGDIFSDFDAPTDSFRTTDRERLKKALQHYEKAASVFAKAQILYAPTEAEKTARQTIERKIERLTARF